VKVTECNFQACEKATEGKMRFTPGFSAEASLYNPESHYRRHFNGGYGVGGEMTIQPALADTCSGGGATCQCSGVCTATGSGCSCGLKLQ
jgi:hypothetical protein